MRCYKVCVDSEETQLEWNKIYLVDVVNTIHDTAKVYNTANDFKGRFKTDRFRSISHKAWKCADGRIVKVIDMDDYHLSNTIDMLRRWNGGSRKKQELFNEFYNIMKIEMHKRGNPLKQNPNPQSNFNKQKRKLKV